jgi:DNA-binding NarL/FixJ family response regulator
MNKSTLILADDHALFRAGLRSLVEDLAVYDVIAETETAEGAIALASLHQPRLLLLDISMQGMSGLEALPRVKEASPNTRVLMVSMYGTPDFVMQALRAGADGYLLKDAAAVELSFALQSVARGRHYLSPAVASAVVEEALAPRAERSAAAPAFADSAAQLLLTPRQIEILTLVVSGRSIKQIAHQLDLSVKTVEAHRAQIMQRLDIRNVPQLVLYAVRQGLITPLSQ